MSYLISLLFVCSLSWGQGVEFEIQTFSDDVVKQGTQKKEANCMVSEDRSSGRKTLSCGSDKESVQESHQAQQNDLGQHSSDYAKQKIRENSRSR